MSPNRQAKPRRTKRPVTCVRQHGAALLILLVILILGTTGLLLGSLNRSNVALERDRITAEVLAQAKEALIQYSASITMAGSRPGDLLIPDVLEPTESPPNYDGTTDGTANGCPGATNAEKRCLGRLPWRDLGMSLDTPTENDTPGVMPWYAVSANLADPWLLDVLNSETANPGTTPPGPGTPQAWITVRDARGNIISNRVAAVIMLPGASIGSQARPAPPNLAGANQYLDSVTVPAGCAAPCIPGTYSNSDFDNDFIMGEDSSRTADLNDNFNDRLIYITIDELMAVVEKRAGNEIKNILKNYYAGWGAYPFAATFANPATSSFLATTGIHNGLLPTTAPSLPTWAAEPTVTFTGGSGNASCQLRGATNSQWRCNLSSISGTPTIRITGVLNRIGLGLWKLHELSDVNQVRVRISGSGSNRLTTDAAISPAMGATLGASLDTAGAATIVFTGVVSSQITRIELMDVRLYTLPAWFTANNWNRVMYYAVSPGYVPGGGNACSPLPGTPSCLTVGGNNRRAVVVMAGAALGVKVRPSGMRADYFEGENATPADDISPADYIYENRSRTSEFNDQVIVVAP